MNDHKDYSRVSRYGKRRNNKRSIIILSSLALLFFIILFSLIAFNKGKQDVETNQSSDLEDTAQQSDESKIENPAEDKQDSGADNEAVDGVGEDENGEWNNEETNIQDGLSTEIDIIEESSDENVIRTYVGNWEPIGTSQVGEHVTNYNDGSDDRIEIKRAASKVTGIAEDNMIEWRVGNDGDQKVYAVISNKEQTDYYRLFLSWIDHEGWQVTKVEKIKEFNEEDY